MGWKERLQKVVGINSYTLNKKGVDAVGEVFCEWMKPMGHKIVRYSRELIGDHLLFVSPKSCKREKILLLGHMDTVFSPGVFEEWGEDEEWVYGPGVCDMKGGIIVALEALSNIKATFGKIEDIDLLLVSDEETGSDDSRALTTELAKDYDLCFVFEAAGKNMEVVTGRKGIGTFEIAIEGVAAHAGTSYSKGVDANLEAAMKMQRLVAMTDLERGSTVNVGRIEGGIGANTISPGAKLLLELRYANHKEKKRLLEGLDKIVSTSFINGTKSMLGGSIQRDVMEPNEKQKIVIEKMEKISGQEILFETRGGVSDANIVSSAGVVTIDGLGPYGDGDHTPKERALKRSFDERIKLMTKVFTHHQKEEL
ncbi:M20 family metallopeptidase [Hydrogenimonas sp.]